MTKVYKSKINHRKLSLSCMVTYRIFDYTEFEIENENICELKIFCIAITSHRYTCLPIFALDLLTIVDDIGLLPRLEVGEEGGL